MDLGNEEAIKVCVRIRPDEDDDACINVTNNQRLEIFKTSNNQQTSFDFHFDKVFKGESSQSDLFDQTLPLIYDALSGFNVNVLAFGMTGSG